MKMEWFFPCGFWAVPVLPQIWMLSIFAIRRCTCKNHVCHPLNNNIKILRSNAGLMFCQELHVQAVLFSYGADHVGCVIPAPVGDERNQVGKLDGGDPDLALADCQ